MKIVFSSSLVKATGALGWFPYLVRTEMINWWCIQYSISSTAGITFIFLSPTLVLKSRLSNRTSRSVFWAAFLFSCSKINSSTEQTEANLPSAIFQSMRFLCNGCRMTFHAIRLFIISEISSFASLIGRTIFLHSEMLSFVFLIGYI